MYKKFYFIILLFVFSCSFSKESNPPDNIFENIENSNYSDNSDTCSDGDTKKCHIVIGQNNNVLTCFIGLQYCINSEWTECTDGEEIKKIPSDDGKPLSITEEQTCENNPCDVYCSKWIEDQKLEADGKVCKWIWNWSDNPADSIDNANKNGAAKEPCTHGSQCHQNQKCQDPGQGTCNHDICTKGIGLKKGCETKCVDLICEDKPQCCEKKYAGSCEVEPCLTYTKGLTKDCDPNVKKTCDWDKTCCPYKQIETCKKWGITGYKEVCDWINTYKCGWRDYYICGWRWRDFYVCGWRWRDFYVCGWRWRDFYVCGWRWRDFYVCGWRWRDFYVCGWRWRDFYVCGWRWIQVYRCGWQQVYRCGWQYYCSFFYCYLTYRCWWEQIYTCWWEQQYVYQCWWETRYVYECWWETRYVYECWWETRYVYECWWETRYVYECWWELRYVYECWWELRYVYECWWEQRYECWWELVKICWTEPVYGWIYYDCEKSYEGEWSQKCIDQYKKYNPGACPMSWSGNWDSTCINAVHDICHNYCEGIKFGSGQCIEWEAPNYDDKCSDFELGIGLTCKDGKTPIIPICNTGSKDAPKGIPIAIMPNSSGYFGTEPSSLPGAKYCYTDDDIPSGECRNIKTCNVVNGDEIMVNPKSNASYNKSECFKGDNWGFYYDDVCTYPPNCPGGYLDTVKKETYESSCEEKLTPQWGYLSWDSDTPKDTEISFRVRTADTKANLANSSWKIINIKSTNSNPDCSALGPSPCPVNLYEVLDKIDAQNKLLELEVTFKVSPDKKQTATLNNWEITYTCIEEQ